MNTRTNIFAVPSPDTIQDIKHFCHSRRIPMNDFQKNPHCTIIYSKTIIPVDEIVLEKCFNPGEIFLPEGKRPKLQTLNTADDGMTLVITFQSDLLSRMHNFLKSEHKLKTSYDIYTPHITLQKNMKYAQPDMELPNLRILFDKYYKDNDK